MIGYIIKRHRQSVPFSWQRNCAHNCSPWHQENGIPTSSLKQKEGTQGRTCSRAVVSMSPSRALRDLSSTSQKWGQSMAA